MLARGWVTDDSSGVEQTDVDFLSRCVYNTSLQSKTVGQFPPHLRFTDMRPHALSCEAVHVPLVGTVIMWSIARSWFDSILLDALSDPPLEPLVEVESFPFSSNISETVYRINGRFTRIPHGSRCALPLDTVATANFSYDRLEHLFSEVPPPPDLILMKRWLCSDTLALAMDTIGADSSQRFRSAHIDLEPLQATGTVTRNIPCSLYSAVFRVAKSNGTTSRFILDGRRFDEIFRSAVGVPPVTPLPCIQTVIEELLSGWSIISSVDAKSMFFQFRVHPSLRAYLGFVFPDGEMWRLEVLPMGICFAPAWAQHVANFLCALLKRRLAHIKFAIFVWIDNFIIASHSEENDRTIRNCLNMIFEEVHLAVKPWEGGTNTLDVLGMTFDLKHRTAAPTHKRITTIRDILHQVTHTQVTCRDFCAGSAWLSGWCTPPLRHHYAIFRLS
jgi:hypothetical protein